jgi:hypothetical protein
MALTPSGTWGMSVKIFRTTLGNPGNVGTVGLHATVRTLFMTHETGDVFLENDHESRYVSYRFIYGLT